jgi:hypothetical protein
MNTPAAASSLPHRRAPAAIAVQYALAAVLPLAAAVPLLELWKADLRVPFDYGGDALSVGMLVKSILENGWYLVNRQLGAPGLFAMHDYPLADSFHFLVIKLLGEVTSDWALTLNLYFLLGFPLMSMAALAVFRHFRLPFGPALAAGVLFSFFPRRLLNGESHLFLDVAYQVPLAILVVLWVCGDAPPLVRSTPGRRWPRLDLRRPRSVAALVICLVTASTGIYYAFFTLCLLLVAGAWSSLRNRTTTHATAGVLLAATLAGGLALQGLPTLLYRHRHGANPEVAVRLPSDSDLHGLKLTQLLLPVNGHRLLALRRLKTSYIAGLGDPREDSASSLGALASVGFLWLLAVVLLTGIDRLATPGPPAGPTAPEPPATAEPRGRLESDGALVSRLAALNLGAVLIATVGGFGPLFAFLVTPQIRAWSRMNVLVGFLSLFAVALLLARLTRHRPRLAILLLPAVLIVGLLDQTSRFAARGYDRTKARYLADARFVRAVEAAVPPGSLVFQLPYRNFPETPPQHALRDYDPLRPYLHARTLRWSYPTMRGRRVDLWATDLVARPLAEQVETLSDVGFAGIVVDRAGYPDAAAGLQASLTTLLGTGPQVGGHERFIFFPLRGYTARARSSRSPAEQQQRHTRALHPLLLRWGAGFYDIEHHDGLPFRWCRGACELQILNGAPTARRATLTMTLVPAQTPAHWTITSPLLSERLPLTTTGTPYTRPLLIPPGTHTLQVEADNPPAEAPSDPRTMVWRAEGYRLVEEPDR